MFFGCSGDIEISESRSSEDLMGNEIWNPDIVLSREENIIVTAKSDKLYKKYNEKLTFFGLEKVPG